MAIPVRTRGTRPRLPRSALLAAVLAAGTVALAACGGDAPEPGAPAGRHAGREAPPADARPGGLRLVVLIAVCTLTKAGLYPYDPDVRSTPTLRQLSEAGLVFERHCTEAGQSGTAYASLFSGSQADVHKVYSHPSVLDDDLYLMAEAFADAGWETWYCHGHAMAEPKLNYAQGVPEEHRIDFDRGTLEGPKLTRFDPDFMELLRGLAGDPDRRALVTATFSYTHGPYTVGRAREAFDRFRSTYPEQVGMTYEEMERWIGVWQERRLSLQWNFPETKAEMGLDDEDVAKIAQAIEIAYRSGVHLLDRHLGFFLQAVQRQGLMDELVLAFTSDHGEVLYDEHALFPWSHGMQLAPEVLGVPLVLFAPGRVPRGRYPGVTRSIDVYPTLAGLAGVELPEGAPVDGLDLSRAVLRQAPVPELTAWFHSTTISPQMFERSGDLTLLRSLFRSPGPESLWVGARRGDRHYRLRTLEDGTWTMEVFDLAAGAPTARDLHDPSDPGQAAMREELEAYRERLRAGFRAPRAPDDALERLRGLGYVDGDDAETGGR